MTFDVVASVAVLIAVFTLAYQIRQERKSSHLQAFAEYTRRYQEIMSDLPSDILSEAIDLESLDQQVREKILRTMRAYFDMCSEEYYLFEQRILKKEVWDLWELGMRDGFRRPAFRQAWEIIQRDKYYFKEFAQFVEERMGA